MTVKTQRTENILRRQVFPIPANVAPVGTRCLMVNIPDDDEHEAIFMGAIDLLCKWNSWQRDSSDSARQASEVWKRAIYDHPMFRACGDEITILIDEMGYEMSICEQLRFHNGKLQALCCGEWTDIKGQGDSELGGPDQPGGGAEQPQPGETVCYNAKLNGSGLWYLPTTVSGGDIIEINNPKGGWYDGSFSAWRCPNGDLFIAGECIDTTFTDGADPLPAEPHMSLIANINGTFYPVLTGSPFTVPGGASGVPVTFQANDSVLTDNQGDISFEVCVTNTQPLAWSHVINFQVTQAGFVIFDNFSCSSGDWGDWTPGQGWTPGVCLNGFTNYQNIGIRATFSQDVAFDTVKFVYDLTQGTHVGSTNHEVSIVSYDVADAPTTRYDANPGPTGTAVQVGSTAGFTCRKLAFFVGLDSVDVPGTPDGSGKVYTLNVTGHGFDPFA